MHNKISISIIIILGLCAASCKKFLQIDLPKNQITTGKVFTDSTNADAAIVGVYVAMMQNFGFDICSGAITTYTGMSSDELYQNAINDNSEFYNNSISTDNSTNAALWADAYKYIYDLNACIEGITDSKTIINSQKEPLIGEAKCIRGLMYFYLTNFYGAVPLIVGTDYQTNSKLPRASIDKIYAQITDDLLSAQTSLSKNSTSNTRANYYAATSLLARVYLYQKNYDSAFSESSLVINAQQYSLMPNLNDIFSSTSTETIWAFSPVYPNLATWEGYYYIPNSSSIIPNYIISPELYNSFQNDDQRKTAWIGLNSINGSIYPYPYKYKKPNLSSTENSENYVVLRLAEQYLIRAEAEVYLNNTTNSLNDINTIRNRAGLPEFTSNDEFALLNEIWNERRWELMCEWGNRWFDLKRTNRVDATLSPLKENWNSNDTLYPIPQVEIAANPNLEQNAGY